MTLTAVGVNEKSLQYDLSLQVRLNRRRVNSSRNKPVNETNDEKIISIFFINLKRVDIPDGFKARWNGAKYCPCLFWPSVGAQPLPFHLPLNSFRQTLPAPYRLTSPTSSLTSQNI